MDQIPALDNTFGAALIGVLVASVLYGVSCSQVFYYFSYYSKKDGPVTKAVVIATFASDSIHQALICHTIYSYLVKSYTRPQQLGEIVWSLIVEVIFNGITALLVQTFFVVRIWKFSHRNVPITAALATFILGEFVSAVVYVAKSVRMTTFAQLATLKPLSMTVNVLAVAGDVLITVVICTLLNRARSSLQHSNTMINLLIAFSVQTGMLTSLCAIASLISISVSPDTFIYICFYFLLGRLYCNSLLATLNVRNVIHGKGRGDLGIYLHEISDSGTPTVDNHKVDGSGRSTSRPRLWGVSRAPNPSDTSRMGAITIDGRQPPIHEPLKQSPSLNAEEGEEDQFEVSPPLNLASNSPGFASWFETSLTCV